VVATITTVRSAVAAPLPGYLAAKQKLAHRLRAGAVVDVTGAERESFLQGQLTQDVRNLSPGDSRPAAGLTPKGKLLFVARVVGLEDRIRLLLPGALRQSVLDHLRKYAVFTQVRIEDRSDDFSRVALYGPAPKIPDLPEWVARVPGEGETTADLLVPDERAGELLSFLEAAGSVEVPDETAEVLRVEAGRPRFGVDMDSANLPDEVGMDDAISTTKGCYVGQEVVARLRTYGRVNRRLVSFRFPDGPIAAGEVLRAPDDDGTSRVERGRVTSSVESPDLGPIGLGYAFRDVSVDARLVSASNPGLSAIVGTPSKSRVAG
jgi:tRNA-modifying protein YgfZ